MQIGPFIILRKSVLPHIEKAHKLARTMTLAEIDDILEGRSHVHGNPKRKSNQAALHIDGGSRAEGAMFQDTATSGVDE